MSGSKNDVKHIITLTMNPAIDKNTTVESVTSDQKLRCRPPRFEAGGGGINVARAVAKLGGSAQALYPAGGFTGGLLESLLDREGLEHFRIPVEGMTRENLTVYESSTGSQYRFGMPGARMSEEEWRSCLNAIHGHANSSSCYLVLSGSLPPGVPDDFYARAVYSMTGADCRLIVDTSGPALRKAAEEGVYLLKPNLRELSQIVERELRDEDEQEAAARELIERGKSSVVVVSLGGAGALLVTRDEVGAIRSENLRAPRVPIRSRIGAGDSMVAGTVLALTRGEDLRRAVQFGMAAGASAVMTEGTELCRRDDAERLFERLTA